MVCFSLFLFFFTSQSTTFHSYNCSIDRTLMYMYRQSEKKIDLSAESDSQSDTQSNLQADVFIYFDILFLSPYMFV